MLRGLKTATQPNRRGQLLLDMMNLETSDVISICSMTKKSTGYVVLSSEVASANEPRRGGTKPSRVPHC